MSLRIRLVGKVSVDDNGCWNYTGAISLEGYGVMWDPRRKKMQSAHRISYELFVGPIPEGKEMDHLCRNRRCANFQHLEAVTRRENTLRGMNEGVIQWRTGRCIYGHPMVESNLYHRKDRLGKRECLACRVRRNAARYPKGGT